MAKQPFFIRPKDGGVLAMAGIYEFWRRPDAAEDDPDAWLVTCAVLTTQSEDDLGQLAAFEVDDDPHAVAVGFIAKIGNALDLLLARERGDFLNEAGFVDLIW